MKNLAKLLPPLNQGYPESVHREAVNTLFPLNAECGPYRYATFFPVLFPP